MQIAALEVQDFGPRMVNCLRTAQLSCPARLDKCLHLGEQRSSAHDDHLIGIGLCSVES